MNQLIYFLQTPPKKKVLCNFLKYLKYHKNIIHKNYDY
jgi:hypothetical protein